MNSTARDPALLLLLAILGAHGAVIVTHSRRPPIADENYYVDKARYIHDHHRLAPADPRSLAVEDGRAWGNSDWRPQGYPVLLAVFGAGAFGDTDALRLRAAIVQFLSIAALLVALYLTVRNALTPVMRYGAAVLIALPPWTFNVVNDFGPDPFTLALAGFSTLAFASYVREGRRLLLASIAISFTLLLRPEMIVMPPLMIAAALLLRSRTAKVRGADLIAAVSPFVIAIALQVGYRTWFSGRVGLFGGHHVYNRGIQDWINTWWGSEKDGIDFAFAVSDARSASLPARASNDALERRHIEGRVALVVARGRYTAEDDAFFAELARKRERERPLMMLALRVWHTVHMWLNIETNTPLLETLADVPRGVRRPMLGGFVVLRVIALVLACIAAWQAIKRIRFPEPLDALVLLALTYALSRSLLMGLILNWTQHRYVDSAWPLVLACATIGMREVQRFRSQRA